MLLVESSNLLLGLLNRALDRIYYLNNIAKLFDLVIGGTVIVSRILASIWGVWIMMMTFVRYGIASGYFGFFRYFLGLIDIYRL